MGIFRAAHQLARVGLRRAPKSTIRQAAVRRALPAAFVRGMGCGQSTSKASSAPAYVLPRPTRRASVNGAPPPPEYYNTEPTTAGSSRSVSAHTNQSASAGAGNDQAAARRLTLIPDANTAKAMAEVGQQTNKKDDKVSLSEVVMREKKAANKGAGDKGASELGLKHVASVSMVGLDVSKKKKRNQDGFFADACFTDPKTVSAVWPRVPLHRLCHAETPPAPVGDLSPCAALRRGSSSCSTDTASRATWSPST